MLQGLSLLQRNNGWEAAAATGGGQADHPRRAGGRQLLACRRVSPRGHDASKVQLGPICTDVELARKPEIGCGAVVPKRQR
jgi:hypothetical protein